MAFYKKEVFYALCIAVTGLIFEAYAATVPSEAKKLANDYVLATQRKEFKKQGDIERQWKKDGYFAAYGNIKNPNWSDTTGGGNNPPPLDVKAPKDEVAKAMMSVENAYKDAIQAASNAGETEIVNRLKNLKS